MKKVKQFISVFAFSCFVSACMTTPTHAATKPVTVTKSNISLTVGKSVTIKLKKANKVTISKTTYKSNKKAVATITNKGKVTAKSVGKATVTITVKGKKAKRTFTSKLTCKITVKPSDPIVKTHTHTYGDWVIDRDSSCTEIGEKSRICTTCQEREVASIPKKEHDFVEHFNSAPDCENDGSSTFTCSVCKETKEQVTKALGHKAVSAHNAVEPTCDTDGKSDDTVCSVCKKTLKIGDTIKAKGHDFANTLVEVTCTDDGYLLHNCKNCSYSKKDAIVPALGHHWITDKTVKEATCTDDGIASTHCSNCQIVKEAVIPKFNHSDTSVVDIPATCTEDGVYKIHCNLCNADLSVETRKALGHFFTTAENGSLRTEATCTTPATYYDACTRCHADSTTFHHVGQPTEHTFTIKQTISSNGHWFVACKTCQQIEDNAIHCTPSGIGCDPFSYQAATTVDGGKSPVVAVPNQYTVFNTDYGKSSDYRFCDFTFRISATTSMLVGLNTDRSTNYNDEDCVAIKPGAQTVTVTMYTADITNKKVYAGFTNCFSNGSCTEFTLIDMRFHN